MFDDHTMILKDLNGWYHHTYYNSTDLRLDLEKMLDEYLEQIEFYKWYSVGLTYIEPKDKCIDGEIIVSEMKLIQEDISININGSNNGVCVSGSNNKINF